MKQVFRALVWSAVLHLLYFAGTVAVGYLKTISYQPDIAAKYDDVVYLQNKVAFGSTISPLFFLASYVSLAAGIAILLFIRKRLMDSVPYRNH
jgi:quinol-cytochrome oxidoreductase complex cytochrome b subunit